MTGPRPATRLDSPRFSLGLTVLIALVALSWQLGVRGLNEPDEGRYASVAVGMLRTGDWIVPHFQGQPHLTKPPLIYWLTALSCKVFGVNEWAARLTPALSAFGVILLTWALAFRWFGARHALYTALLLLSAPMFFVLARLCDTSMLLTLWVTLGSWAWVSWQADGKPCQRWLYYLAHGLAFLTKGPVGCAIILLGQLAFHLVGDPTRPRRRIWCWGGFLLALAMSLSWYLLMVLQQPDRLDYFLRYELFDRVFTNVHKRSEPLLFFWWVLPASFLPWLPVLAPIVKRGRRTLRAKVPEAPLIAHILAILILFTISRSKLPTYILPALPLLALLTAAQMKFDDEQGRHYRWAKGLAATFALAIPIIVFYLSVTRLHSNHLIHGAMVLAVGVILLLLWRLKRCSLHRWLIPAALAIMIAYASALDLVRRGERALFGKSTQALIKDWRIASGGKPGPFYYTHAPAGLLFYLHPDPDPKPLTILKTGEKMDPADYVEQLRRHLESLRGQGAYVLANSSYINSTPGGLARLPGQVMAQDKKHTILQAP